MTFNEIVARIKEQCNLTSTEATTRVGKSVNQFYRRITSQLGLEGSRFVTRSVSTTNGQQYVTFTDIEKIDRVIDATDSDSIRVLRPVGIDEQRTTQPGTGEPTSWALRNTDADSVVILLDTLPQTTYSLQADGTTTLSDLSGSDEPVFPESFHDILVYYVLAEELRRKEKVALAREYANDADRLLSELRFHLADTTENVRQGDRPGATVGGSGSGGGGSIGGTAYTQSALLTFDRGAATAPFAVAQSDAAVVTNLDADKLDGQHGSAFARIDGSQPFNNTGLQVKDTNASHDLIIKPGSDLTAERTLTLTTGDADRTVTLSGNPTLNDWFDQSVKVAATPTFGATTVTGALTISGAAAGQIIFPASQNASSNANTLDDYEEGSWTPTVGGSTSESGQAYSLQVGRYIKVGKMVHAFGRVTLSTLGTITGDVVVKGLPFTVENINANLFSCGTVGFWTAFTTSLAYLTVIAMPDTTQVRLQASTAAATGLGVLAQADLAATSSIAFSITYQASA